ncbi:hypothetical protein ACTHPH_02560 [Paenibacillus pasadenensis]|uniref:MoaD/ThiS family protein n=1 Tax=Paenibacillus pasadenensis TaxID=217090 RepID=A0A2N5N6R9_9BACL|nr:MULTISPECIES: hypothetical protein [Paenibacillus]PLT46051.1 hypothetical protein B8V81_4482 [Paenibacillus pasadenensis]QGG56530.1 hypothetical protein GE073_13700 [Paenibacillus sp. B01]
MEGSMKVVLYQKLPGGSLRKIDERSWSAEMLAALHHINYLTVGGEEFETVEGRLNVDEGVMELLLISIPSGSR